MANVNLAKVLDSRTDFSSIDNNTWVLSKGAGDNDGIRLSYRNSGSNIRILSPYEEFDSYYRYTDDENDTAGSVGIDEGTDSSITLSGDKGNKVVILNLVGITDKDDIVVTLPAIDTTSLSNGVYFTQKIKFIVDNNRQGFYINVKNASTDKIVTKEGNKTSLSISRGFVTFDVFIAPDGKWRINGEYEVIDNFAEVLALTA